MDQYPVRARIIDVVGVEVFPGVMGATPDVSKPHIGKEGLAELVDGLMGPDTVRITLDDGSVLYGYECWWEPVEPSWLDHAWAADALSREEQ